MTENSERKIRAAEIADIIKFIKKPLHNNGIIRIYIYFMRRCL